MLHLVLYGLLAVIVAVGLFLIATRFLPAGEQIAPPLRDEPPWELPPERSLQADDVDGVRLPVALRGYRFAETDILLDRLANELRSRDEELARLRGRVPVSLDKNDGEDGHGRYAPPSTGPSSAGPSSTGPSSAGPSSAGPSSTAPSSAAPAPTGAPTSGPKGDAAPEPGSTGAGGS